MRNFCPGLMLLLFLTEPVSLSQIFSPAQSEIEISKLLYPVNFDGIPDEEGWKYITPLKMTMHSPSYGKEPSEETEVRFACDDKYLYMGARLHYKDISMIRSASYKRDYTGLGSDLFGFILDTYNDNENGTIFYTTPDGLRFDASIQRDAVLTRPDQKPMNLSWNAFWDVRTAIDDKEWTAEIRVPFSSLRFQQTEGIVRMGLIVRRMIPAKNEIDTYPALPPDWGEYSTIKPSKAQDIILRNVKPAKPIPYKRRDFYKIMLVIGKSRVHYADRVITVKYSYKSPKQVSKSYYLENNLSDHCRTHSSGVKNSSEAECLECLRNCICPGIH